MKSHLQLNGLKSIRYVIYSWLSFQSLHNVLYFSLREPLLTLLSQIHLYFIVPHSLFHIPLKFIFIKLFDLFSLLEYLKCCEGMSMHALSLSIIPQSSAEDTSCNRTQEVFVEQWMTKGIDYVHFNHFCIFNIHQVTYHRVNNKKMMKEWINYINWIKRKLRSLIRWKSCGLRISTEKVKGPYFGSPWWNNKESVHYLNTRKIIQKVLIWSITKWDFHSRKIILEVV